MGIQQHSTNLPYQWLAVFAVGGLVRAAGFNAWLDAAGIRFQQCVGSYKGETERCFIVPLDEIADLGRGRSTEVLAGWVAGQESVLLLSPAYRNGRLYGSREAYIVPVVDGWFSPVPLASQYIGLYHFHGRSQPAIGDWTFNPDVPGFFTVKPGSDTRLSDDTAAEDATDQNAGNAALAVATTHERLMEHLSGPMGRKMTDADIVSSRIGGTFPVDDGGLHKRHGDMLPVMRAHAEAEFNELGPEGALRGMVENAEDA